MKFLALIPARYASTRFPGKPLADIGGMTMIERVYRRVNAMFDKCYVATDDDRIYDVVKAFGGNVVITSVEHRSGTDRCAEALSIVEREGGEKFDVVINIQGDEPFVSPDHLTKIRSIFESQDDVQIATLIKPFGDKEDIFNPNSPKVVVSVNGDALYFSRSVIPFIRSEEDKLWQVKHVFYKHIGLYAYTCDILREITRLPVGTLEQAESLEQLRWLENGYKIATAQTTTESIAIDTPYDLEQVLKSGLI